MSRLRKLFLTLVVPVLPIAFSAPVVAQCTPFGLGLYYVDPTVPVDVNVSHFPPGGPAVTMIGDFNPSAVEGCEGDNEALLEVTIPEGCSEAVVWVAYEGEPIGWTLNIGDTDENNGFGGDAGSPEKEAELQILDETLSVYSIALNDGDPPVDRLARADLGLTDGGLQIVVGHQTLSWGQSYSALDCTNSELLFALPDVGAPEGKQNTFYIGVNRVISGPGDRTGCGVRRLMVSFR